MKIMKSILAYLIPVLFLLAGKPASAQIVIDLSTGISNTGQLLPINSSILPYNSLDDTWKVHIPGTPTNQYTDLAVSNGWVENLGYMYPLKSSSVGWLSPYVNAIGEYRQQAIQGQYEYKMTFNLSSCAIQSATFAFTHWLADDGIDEITLNGSTLLGGINGPLSPNIGYYNYIITGAGFNQGLNTITIKVNNSAFGWVGMELDAKLYLKTCGTANLSLKDKDGTEKDVFCIEDDVFFNVNGVTPNSYNITLQKLVGSAFTTVASSLPLGGSPNNLNVKDLFENQYGFTFQTNFMYKAIITFNTFCGTFQVEKTFIFYCCTTSPDASFNVITGPNSLTGQSSTSGTHVWTVYSPSYPTPIATYNTPEFSLYENGPCYYVKHTVINTCGTKCSTQNICYQACEVEPCAVATPTNVVLNTRGNTVTWSPSTGAAYYVLQVIINDPACCPGPYYQLPMPLPLNITVTGTSHQITNPELGGLTGINNICFSVKVYAVCADGSWSEASVTKCSNQ